MCSMHILTSDEMETFTIGNIFDVYGPETFVKRITFVCKLGYLVSVSHVGNKEKCKNL